MLTMATRRFLLPAMALCFLSLSSVISAEEPAKDAAEAKPDIGADLITIVIGGAPISGYPVYPATDKSFKLKERDTGQVVTLDWDSLKIGGGDPDSEVRRVKKLYGLETTGAKVHWPGEQKIAGVKYTLLTGKTIEGMPLPDRDMPGQKALKTAGAPCKMVPEFEIKTTENIECFESEFFTPQEIYARWLLEKPPSQDDASAFLDLAKKCANMGLYRESLDNLTKAEIIDPRTKERNMDMRQEVIKLDAEKQSSDLYDKMVRACLSKDYFVAADYYEKLKRNFPASEKISQADQRKAEIDAGTKTEKKKQVIFRAYILAQDLIANEVFKKIKIDKKGNVVASIPGKQVTTKNGDIFRGTLSDPDPSGALAMRVGDMDLTIAQKDIMAISDVDLSVGVAEVRPSFDDMKDYVTDTRRPDGLKMTMMNMIASALKMKTKEVQGIFDERLKRTGHYENGQLEREAVYVSLHDAAYGKGSWLRDGAKPLPLIVDDQGGGGGGKKGGGNVNSDRINRNQNGNLPQQQKQEVEPELSDDPNIWWASQSPEFQQQVLRAMAGEKLFHTDPQNIKEMRCAECGGVGTVVVNGPGGRPITYRCPKCRGLTSLTSLLFE